MLVSIPQRVIDKINFDGPVPDTLLCPLCPSTPCWEWVASKLPKGYGNVRWNGEMVYAHRLVYELLVAQVSDGLTLDHLCRNTSCVNPDHLEPVTQKVNTHRGEGPAALNARKTHCIHGHEFSERNTYLSPDGRRECRTCHAERSRARRSK